VFRRINIDAIERSFRWIPREGKGCVFRRTFRRVNGCVFRRIIIDAIERLFGRILREGAGRLFRRTFREVNG
jgi:hypothetical protein